MDKEKSWIGPGARLDWTKRRVGLDQEQGLIGPGEGLDWTRSKVGLDKEQGWIRQGDGFELTRMQNSSKMNSISLEEEMTEFINNQVILDRGWVCE